MLFWEKPDWFDARRRREQLEDHVRRSRMARFGIRKMAAEAKHEAVREHFDRIAGKYDFMNSLLSLGIQHVWKRTAIRMLALKPGQRILDVCGGTGDLALGAAQQVGSSGQVVVYDINWAMLTTGRPKAVPRGLEDRIVWVQGDAERISFPDDYFDAAMVGFGIRNVTHLEQAFREMMRVLKPGGKLLCLEFSRPTNPLFRQVYDFYSFSVMPALGQLLAGSAQSYACLPETIRMFPLPEELAQRLREIGCERVIYRPMTNGIAVAHLGWKRR
ncbi:MAG: bifunctional demethylmenaquinone methyltransferase/2-methoxy-6-polyprenyl-1,4-benzoquinol methylase UbiE [Desulfosarcinaceae bacterium]|nr:bifunctional demethylmenaquinone methyltransferase/2-methoxy-6-polyprenyl-1,4-benzoquinol methylase UbiE [Desulfosarcinaceae bacterium]